MRIQWAYLAVICAFATVACDKHEDSQTSVTTTTSKTLTPFDQGSNDVDRNITASLRRWVVGDKDLSIEAKNVTIITNNGAVTLQGMVKNQAERNAIDVEAANTNGVLRVDDQIKVEDEELSPPYEK